MTMQRQVPRQRTCCPGHGPEAHRVCCIEGVNAPRRYGNWQYHYVGLPVIGYWGGGWGGYGAGYWGNSYYDSGELSCFRAAWQDKLGAAAPHVETACHCLAASLSIPWMCWQLWLSKCQMSGARVVMQLCMSPESLGLAFDAQPEAVPSTSCLAHLPLFF